MAQLFFSFAGLFLLVVLLGIGFLVGPIPNAVLAGILITVGIGIIDYKGLYQTPGRPAVLWLRFPFPGYDQSTAQDQNGSDPDGPGTLRRPIWRLYAMEEAIQELQGQGILVVFTGLHGQPLDMFKRINLIPGLVSEEYLFETFEACVNWLKPFIRDEGLDQLAIDQVYGNGNSRKKREKEAAKGAKVPNPEDFREIKILFSKQYQRPPLVRPNSCSISLRGDSVYKYSLQAASSNQWFHVNFMKVARSFFK